MSAVPPARHGVPDRSIHEQRGASSLSRCHTASSQTMSAESALEPADPQRCSAPADVPPSAAHTTPWPRPRQSRAPWPEARSSESAVPRSHPCTTGTAAPEPKRSDDPPHPPWFVPPTHGASAYPRSRSRRIPCRLHQPEFVSLAFERGFALFLEGANALAIILAVVHHTPQPLNPLETLWRHRMRSSQDPQLLLHDRNAQWSIRRDLVRQMHRKRLQIRSGYDVVDHSVSLSPRRIDWLGRKGHLLGHAQARGVQKREHPTHIVRHAEFSGRDRERGGLGGHDQIAGKDGLGSPAPDATLDHGKNRPGVVLDLAHELAERVIPAERIATALGQLVDIVTG